MTSINSNQAQAIWRADPFRHHQSGQWKGRDYAVELRES
jgi:hypothetical protein